MVSLRQGSRKHLDGKDPDKNSDEEIDDSELTGDDTDIDSDAMSMDS